MNIHVNPKTINRRAVLVGAAAATALAAGQAAAIPQSEIQRLYAMWLTRREAYVAAVDAVSDVFDAAKAAGLDKYEAERECEATVVDPAWDAMRETELLIYAEPAVSMDELAIKITIAFSTKTTSRQSSPMPNGFWRGRRDGCEEVF